MNETITFEQFFHKNYDHLFFFALRILGNEEDSRDIVDDAMEYIWANFKDKRVDDWFRYSVSFIRNKSVDKLRHDNVHRRYAQFYTYMGERMEAMTFEGEDERLTLVKEAIALLPERTRLILIECFVHQKNIKR